MRTIVIAALASLGVGLLAVQCAPTAWRIDPWQGILLGTALYMGAFHPWLVRRRAENADSAAGARADAWLAARSRGWRVALFLAIAAGEVYAYYEWLPVADLRAPFALLSAWVVVESIGAPRSATSASPRA
jgi:cyanate permease